ncbi:MAG: FAD:protein FMN transferase [Gemmatimonadales bacterium]
MTTSEQVRRRAPDRREFLTIGAGVFVALALPVALVRRIALVRRTVPLMGTIAEVQVAHRDERRAQDAIDAALDELLRVERTMTRFRGDSDIGRANLGAARDGVRISPATATVITAALGWSALSDGRFDPAIGATSELWDVLNRHEPPAAERVRRLAGRGFWRKVDVGTHRGAPAVRFEDSDLHLDLGAIAKGYAIDRATDALRSRGIAHAIVTVGGDLYALGESPAGGPWKVGIRDPHDLRALAARLDVSDRAVATSGDYERFFRWRGMRFHHLMDPVTAAPRRTGIHSVTVLADCAMDADAASTSVFGLSREPARQLVRRVLPDADVIPLT